MIEPGICTDDRLSNRTPLYSSKRSFKNLWQEYRIYLDRIELQCWIGFHTLKIPLRDIVEIIVAPPLSISYLCQVKIDNADFYRHVELTKKSGLMKHISFTPDNPDEFADAIRLLMDNADKKSSLMENNG